MNRNNKLAPLFYECLTPSAGNGRRFLRQEARERPNLKSICANVYALYFVFFSSPKCFKFINAKFQQVSTRLPKVGQIWPSLMRELEKGNLTNVQKKNTYILGKLVKILFFFSDSERE